MHRLAPLSASQTGQAILSLRTTLGSKYRNYVIRRPVQVTIDAVCGAIASLLAFLVRFDFHVPTDITASMLWCVLIMFLLTPIALSLGGGYRSTWKHFGARDFTLLAGRLLLLSSALLLIVMFGSGERHIVPFGVTAIEFMLVLGLTCGIRLLRRLDFETLSRLANKERILVVATEATVATALRQLQPLYGRGIVGILLADSIHSRKLRIAGIPVLGSTADVSSLLIEHRVSFVVLCSSSLANMDEVVQAATDHGITLKLLPSVQDLVSNRIRVSKTVTPTSLRKDALLHADMHADVVKCFRGKTVLVTGAAGSIGSELVRQVVASPAAKLLLLDQDENGIFELLGELGKNDKLHPVVGDIREEEMVRALFERHRPDIVLHAAAYKHVPLMEANPCEAVLNNVLGTRNLAEASVAFGAERMVMISSDKAVKPSNVMGATKRLAEVVIQELSDRVGASCRTNFACVRFGNVLGSRGSVLPIFLRQIEQGGPVTITNEEMTRYFMTIPQAVRLVLQAATLASCGHIYMLDMGDPVRIINLARQVIQMTGLTPDKDIEIRIVGSRPGEKLHEQLWNEDAEVSKTNFEHVFEVKAEVEQSQFHQMLTELEVAARKCNEVEVLRLLQALPVDYQPERSLTFQPATPAQPEPAIAAAA